MIWEFLSGKHIHTFTGHSDRVNNIKFSPDGKILASCSLDMTCRIWEVSSGKQIHTLRGHTSEVIDIEFSLDGSCLGSFSWDETCRIWDVSSGEQIHSLQQQKTWEVTKIQFSTDG